jgi:hypothetical protein
MRGYFHQTRNAINPFLDVICVHKKVSSILNKTAKKTQYQATTMENAVFEPTSNRMHDLLQNVIGTGHSQKFYDSNFQEVKLREGRSAADILHENCACDDFLSLARHTLVWLGEGVFGSMVYREAFRYIAGYEVALRIDVLGCSGKLRVWRSQSAQTETNVCDVVVQLLARDSFPRAHLYLKGNQQCSVSSNALSKLLESPCPSLGRINFCGSYQLTEDCLRALEGGTNPGLQVYLEKKDLSHFDPMSLQTFLRNCQGAITLLNCTVDIRLLSEVLRGESKVMELFMAPQALTDANTTGLIDALKTNKCLTEISFASNPVSDKNWIRICRAIAHHPKLQKVCLRAIRSTPSTIEGKVLRTNAVLRMLRDNYVLQHVDTPLGECDEHIQRDVILPYLKHARNIRALNDHREPMRAQLLGRAVRKVNNDPTLLWMVLSNNSGFTH